MINLNRFNKQVFFEYFFYQSVSLSVFSLAIFLYKQNLAIHLSLALFIFGVLAVVTIMCLDWIEKKVHINIIFYSSICLYCLGLLLRALSYNLPTLLFASFFCGIGITVVTIYTDINFYSFKNNRKKLATLFSHLASIRGVVASSLYGLIVIMAPYLGFTNYAQLCLFLACVTCAISLVFAFDLLCPDEFKREKTGYIIKKSWFCYNTVVYVLMCFFSNFGSMVVIQYGTIFYLKNGVNEKYISIISITMIVIMVICRQVSSRIANKALMNLVAILMVLSSIVWFSGVFYQSDIFRISAMLLALILIRNMTFAEDLLLIDIKEKIGVKKTTILGRYTGDFATIAGSPLLYFFIHQLTSII